MNAKPPLDHLRALPNPEVHPHLEGCFDSAVLEQWAAQAGVAMPRPRDRLLQCEGQAAMSYGCSRCLADSGAGFAEQLASACTGAGAGEEDATNG